MRSLPLLLALGTAACASAAGRDGATWQREVYPGATVEAVREAALRAVSEVTTTARVTDDGRVVGERGRSAYPETWVVRVVAVEDGAAAEVDVHKDGPCSRRAARETRTRSKIYLDDAVIFREDGGYEVVRASVASGRGAGGGIRCNDFFFVELKAERRILAAIGAALPDAGPEGAR